MKLLDMNKSSAAVFDGFSSMDSLWDRAEQLGRTTIERDFSGLYAQIRFERRSGSMVYAKGRSSDVREALRLAIDEAIALGARP